ncbi:AtpZ/AtpI family protein [Leptospira semungkisensis]|uniref:AtpZ/AtpI family protein n=1 Tax=Leptospira semungkisensis TaxID=2484985 RepID=A0A4R9G0X2_9LEPT|nr:AtpZ/AtpI family protein [Leptospira semungkisensis]TGK04861.1 AtpZ/AtpI family protein [Leptospira semungkisensis]
MEESPKPPSDKNQSPWGLASLGMEFCFIIGASFFIGRYLDSKFSWSPFGILGGLVFGFSYGIYYILYRAGQFEKGDK